MTTKQQDQNFVEMVVREIVDHPDDVKVDRTVDDRGVLLSLSINPEDMGKVIGKEGKTAEALRTLLRIVGSKNNARVNLKILEPEGQNGKPEPKREPEAIEEAKSEDPIIQDDQPLEEEENATEII